MVPSSVYWQILVLN
ncbi:hypothetical protein MXB_1791 [Myxobolus squamalis]|nr:hypothetical protein MXB_1791 [Myxobolus squamalis]